VVYYVLVIMVVVFWLAELIFVRNVYFLLCILIIHCGLPFFYIMYKLCVSLVMQLSKEMLPNFLSPFFVCFLICGRVFGNTHCVGAMGCYTQTWGMPTSVPHAYFLRAQRKENILIMVSISTIKNQFP
jgi:hypothetical protein